MAICRGRLVVRHSCRPGWGPRLASARDGCGGNRRGGCTRGAALEIISSSLVSWLWRLAPAVPRASPGGARRFRRRRWWDGECQRLWTERQQSFCLWRSRPTPESREHFRRARNRFGHAVRVARRGYWSSVACRVSSIAGSDFCRAARLVRREFQGSSNAPPSSMLDPGSGVPLTPEQTSAHWPSHFATAAQACATLASAPLTRQVRRCVRRLHRAAAAPDRLDFLFSAGDLAAARRCVQSSSAPGEDRLPYAPFCVDWEPWNAALLAFFNLVLRFGRVPPSWLRGVVVPLPKPGDPCCFDNWRPITLLSCVSKLFERLALPRLSEFLDPGLADCQAGFRFGADEQARLLLEALRLRAHLPGHRRTLVAFVDIRKAYDSVWRDGLLVKLWARGVRGRLWALCAALLGDTSARVRVGGSLSREWAEGRGVRQGAILSPLLFLVFIW